MRDAFYGGVGEIIKVSRWPRSKNVQRLEDESAIKVLKGRYCEYCDNAYDPDGIASLFVEAGIWDGGFMGRFEGLCNSRALCRHIRRASRFTT